jgi:hypothetical protein
VVGFYWGTNPGEDYIYWMMERTPPQSGNPRTYFFVYLDLNGDGDTDEAQDRVVRVLYDPRQHDSRVTVTVFSGTGTQISQSTGDWGESRREGGARAEWRVSFADLGIDAHQTIDMYGAASQNANAKKIDRVPDSGTITWVPVPILGWPGLICAIAIATGAAWYRQRRKE